MEHSDIVIVGAGIYGLTTASTYHYLHPEAKIIIIDAAPSLGGPWAAHRIFPGLRTNNILGMYEHPDFPFDPVRFGVKEGEHIPAAKMLEYLEAFTDWSGIRPFLRFNTRIEILEKDDDTWILLCNSGTFKTKKVVLANGTTTQPSIPQHIRSPTFLIPVIHSKDFPQQYNSIARPNTNTLVIGSGKSAMDICYACATQPGSTATMLFRPDGNGPIYMPPPLVTPLSIGLEKLVFTRLLGFIAPCPWAKTTGIEGWLRSFFHHTWLGNKIGSAFWQTLSEDVITLNKLNNHPQTKKLLPWSSAFEIGTALGIHNYPSNFFDLVRQGRIKIVMDEVSSLEQSNTVTLKSGDSLMVDAVVYATGWKIGNTVDFRPSSLQESLGLPTVTPDYDNEVLLQDTEKQLYKEFPALVRDLGRPYHPNPALRSVPATKKRQQPFRLHNFMVPPALIQERNVAFAGAMQTLGTFPCAYIQSLWIAAYFDGRLQLPDKDAESTKAEAYRNTQYCTLRYSYGCGSVSPDIVWETLPYFDMLLKDLGLTTSRKGGFFGLGDLVKSYSPRDYKGLIDEWSKSHRADSDKD